jgi:hypothetical protein
VITNFRIAAEDVLRDDVVERLLDAAGVIIEHAREFQPPGEWELTQDVTEKSEHGYRGRMNFVYHREQS